MHKDAVYVQLQGKKDVVVVSKSVYERLNRTLDDLRDRTVIEFLSASATRIEIKSADRVIELAKSASTTNAEPHWALTRPLAARADQRKVSELLTDLGSLRVTDFVSDDPKDIHAYQLDEPEREVTVWTGESGKTLQLGHVLTNELGQVYAKLKSIDSIYTVPAATVQKSRFNPTICATHRYSCFRRMTCTVSKCSVERTRFPSCTPTQPGESWRPSRSLQTAALCKSC